MKTHISIIALLATVPALAQGVNPSASSLLATGTGGSISSTLADRATYKGVRFDLRADFGAKCDGSTNDTAAYTSMLAAVGSTFTPIVVTFPGACLISPGNYSTSGNLSFEGISGGGLKLTGATLSVGSLMSWNGSYTINIRNFTLDMNSSLLPAPVASPGNAYAFGFTFNGSAAPVITGSTIKNATAPTGGIATVGVLTGGNGWTPSITNGSIIYSGAGCTTPPVLTVSTNSSGVVTAVSVANSGVCTGGLASAPGYGVTTWAANGSGITTTGAATSFTMTYQSNSSILAFTPNSNPSPMILKDSVLSFNGTSMFSNQTAQWGGSGSIVTGNTFINSGVASYSDGSMLVALNLINGFGYGAGVTYEPLYAALGDFTDTGSSIVNNTIINGASYYDANNTHSEAIENGFYGVRISGNKTYKTCGPGITVYGKDQILNNTVGDANLCNSVNTFYQNGIALESDTGPGGTNTASGSFVDGNTVYEDGGGLTQYGYGDTTLISGVVLGVNNFQGISGAYNIQGGSTFASPQTDNRAINGCFQYDQRLEGSMTQGGFGSDQWTVGATGGAFYFFHIASRLGQCAWAQQAYVAVQTTPSSSDQRFLYQNIPANDLQDLNFGTVNAETLIKTFCAKTSAAPPVVGSYFLWNGVANRSYVNTFTITAPANTVQCFSFRVPGDPLGPITAGATTGIRHGFDLGSGSQFLTSTLGVWQAGYYYGATTETPIVSLPVATTIQFSAARLLPASADEGWAPKTAADEFRNVRRFYRKSFPVGVKPAQNVGTAGQVCFYGTGYPWTMLGGEPMNATPTVLSFNPSAANANWRDETAGADVTAYLPAAANSSTSVTIAATGATGAAGNQACIHYTLDAGL